MIEFDIITKRLFLRKIEKNDLKYFSKLFGDPDVMKFSTKGLFSKKKCQKILKNMLNDEKKHGFAIFVVLNNKTLKWMGIIGITWFEKIYLVYRFFKQFWNQGYATEAAKGFIEYFQKNHPKLPIYANIQKENFASIKIAEKLGMNFVQKTTFHGKPVLEYFLKPKNK